jgi:hypothetical protein
MVHYHNIEQGSPEWFELRKRKLTASHATAIGASGAGLKTYCKEIVLELIGIEKEHYTNADIERGNELESIARSSYEFQTGNEVEEVGFITNDKFENAGMSPDGLIGEDGGCEIKARNDIKHLSLILGETKEIPVNQIQMSLLISERKWWDFISFNPNFKNPLFIKRIYPDPIYFEKLKKGIIEGNKLIEQILITLNKKNYDFS